MSTSPARELGAGLRAALPLALAIVPFMTVFGVLMYAGGFSPLIAQAMSVLVFAGAQLVVAQMLLAGAPAALIVAAGATMNARHLLYSASIAPYLCRLPLGWRVLLAYLLTDETYLLSMQRYQQSDQTEHRQWFLLGAGLDIWVACQASTALGSLLGTQVPATWHLEFTATLTFLALLMHSLRDWASRGTALVAGVSAVLAAGLPFESGMLVAASLGLVVGLTLDARTPAQREVPA
jgi:4-azaleucine resistance transporter AzlC